MTNLIFKQKMPVHQFCFELQQDRIAVIYDNYAYIYESLIKSIAKAKAEALNLFLASHKGDGLKISGKKGVYYISSIVLPPPKPPKPPSPTVTSYEFTNGMYITSPYSGSKPVMAQVCFQFMSDKSVNVWIECDTGGMLKSFGKKLITVEDYNYLRGDTTQDFNRNAFAIFNADVLLFRS